MKRMKTNKEIQDVVNEGIQSGGIQVGTKLYSYKVKIDYVNDEDVEENVIFYFTTLQQLTDELTMLKLQNALKKSLGSYLETDDQHTTTTQLNLLQYNDESAWVLVYLYATDGGTYEGSSSSDMITINSITIL